MARDFTTRCRKCTTWYDLLEDGDKCPTCGEHYIKDQKTNRMRKLLILIFSLVALSGNAQIYLDELEEPDSLNGIIIAQVIDGDTVYTHAELETRNDSLCIEGGDCFLSLPTGITDLQIEISNVGLGGAYEITVRDQDGNFLDSETMLGVIQNFEIYNSGDGVNVSFITSENAYEIPFRDGNGLDVYRESGNIKFDVDTTIVATKNDIENININDNDSLSNNELNTAINLNGTTLELTDAGGTLTQDLSSLQGTTLTDHPTIDFTGSTAIVYGIQTQTGEDANVSNGRLEHRSGNTNTPTSGNTWGWFDVCRNGSSTRFWQLASRFTDNKLYFRNMYDGSTSGWQDVFTELNPPTRVEAEPAFNWNSNDDDFTNFNYGSTNGPISGASGISFANASTNTDEWQLAGADNVNVYHRYKSGGVWQAWQRVLVEGNLSTIDLSEFNNDLSITQLWTQSGSDVYRNSKVGIGSTTISNYADLHVENGKIDTDATSSYFGDGAGANGSGNFNVGVGLNALANGTIGTGNVAIGSNTGLHSNGTDNTMIGTSAGQNNSAGSGNVFIGHDAGLNANVNNELYITNSNDTSPLIHGDFDSDEITINGDGEITGNLDIGGNVDITGELTVTDQIGDNAINIAGFASDKQVVRVSLDAATLDLNLGTLSAVIPTPVQSFGSAHTNSATYQTSNWPNYVNIALLSKNDDNGDVSVNTSLERIEIDSDGGGYYMVTIQGHLFVNAGTHERLQFFVYDGSTYKSIGTIWIEANTNEQSYHLSFPMQFSNNDNLTLSIKPTVSPNNNISVGSSDWHVVKI